MSKVEEIVFSGGGSGGHVLPAITLINHLKKNHPEVKISYIGDANGIESKLISEQNIQFQSIMTGKLRRYISFQNFIDIFKVMIGIIQSFFILLGKRNSIVFCSGGFVTVPVAIASFLTGKKMYIHEQTSRVGLANKINSIFADKVFVTFEESLKFFPNEKTLLSGYPLRPEIGNVKRVDFDNILKSFNLSDGKPVLFVTGGGNGSLLLNNLIKDNLDELKDKFTIVHQVGKNFEEEYSKLNNADYYTSAFFGEEMIALMKYSSVVISRAGAGTVVELMALGKPSIFVPLAIAQKNEQYHNAMEAHKKVGSIVIEEKNLSSDEIFKAIDKCLDLEMKEIDISKNATQEITSEIL
ncbi:MAG: undecaprenyldiphospho-muramoylpentapeptide beta-N-acetylglucosaminyltransferase [Oligoflexia bacterium]|nr:undecaprenyldiphospho-muramoylpentapeptide beta-N-acetylglucosaminyltransferase [Oligoflexia bacterium]